MKVFGQHVHAPILLLVLAEYVLAGVAFLAAGSLLVEYGVDVLPDGRSLPWTIGFSTSVVLAVTAVGLYQPKQRFGVEAIVVRLIAALGLAVLALALLEPIFSVGLRGSVLTLSFVLSFVLLGTVRMLFVKLVDHEAFQRRVLVYGAGDRAASLLKLRRRSDRRGFKIIAFVTAPGDRTRIADDRVMAVPDDLLEYASRNRIDEIVVAMDDRREGFPVKDLLACRFSGIAVLDLLNFFERETGRVKVDLVNPAWLIFSEGFSSKRLYAITSAAVNLVLATALAFLSFPVMVVIAIAIVIEDGFPILYKQKRVGFAGRTFQLYKFRSMYTNAESDGRARWAKADDPRVTRVGRVIRKLRLDELPQLFNVIRGDMNLVGPRPERPEFVEMLSQKIPYYHERHSVKPGLTGWAQLCYPYGSSEHDAMEKLQYDLYYIKHRSLIFDLMVLLQTVELVLWGKGAR